MRNDEKEECDDQNNQNDDGCTSDCKVEFGYWPVGGDEDNFDVMFLRPFAEIKEIKLLS